MAAARESSPVTPIGLPRWMGVEWPLALGILALLVAPFDQALVAWMNPDEPLALLDALAHFLDKWSTRLELTALLSLFFLSHLWSRLARERAPLAAFVTSWILCEAVVGTLKRVVGRPRPVHPDGMVEQLRVLFDHADLKSFPSGHTAMAVVAAFFVAAWQPRRRLLVGAIWAAAVLIGLGRIYIGAHHPSDVLAGAAIGWFLSSVSWKAVTPGEGLLTPLYPGARRAPLMIMAWMVVLAWLFKAPLEVVDMRTRLLLEGWSLPQVPPWATVFEPFTGPARKLASLSGMKSAALWGGLWFLGAAALALWRWGRRALVWIAGVVLLAVVWGVLSITGGTPWKGAPHPRGEAGAFQAFDLQSHLGDPYDGAVGREAGLKRFKALGYHLVVPTWHDAWAQGAVLNDSGTWQAARLWGAEWSAGDPAAHPLHLLVFNRRPEPGNLGEIKDYRELIRRVHAAGGVVLGSHFWRWDRESMPTIEELFAAGIDGFEVAGRNQETGEGLRRQDLVRRFVREHGLTAIGDSDFHGRRSYNHVWNLVSADSGTALDDAVWECLSRRPGEHEVVAVHSWQAEGPLAPIAAAVSYLRELTLKGRLSWFVWLLLLGWTLHCVEKRRGFREN